MQWTPRNAKKVITLLLSLLHSDWLKHQILQNRYKAACILIPSLLTNFCITKSCLSLSNTVEILCEEHFNIAKFSWPLLASLMIGWNLLTQKTTLKMELKYILFHRLPFWRLMHSMCENENLSMWGKHIVP